MAGQRRKKHSPDPIEAFRWPSDPGREPSKRSDAPVMSLLALNGALLASHADGQVAVYPVETGSERLLGAPWELCRLDPPASAMAFCGGEVVSASGSRLERVLPDGTRPEPLELDAPVGALTARDSRVYAVAGDTVHAFERDGDGWSAVHRTPVPLSDCHDIDVDRRGKHVVVCQRPDRGYVVELATGAVVGHCNLGIDARKTVTETYARFSPVTDNLYRAASRAHHVEKLARLGKSGRSLGWRHELDQPSTWCTPLASSPEGRYVASRQSGVGVLVWDLQTEKQVLFAELDDAPADEKFARSARRAPVAARPLGADSIKITRWANLPERDGETTAVAVAPGAAYAATGDRHGVLTVVDVGTRRIECGHGLVRQPGGVSVVEVGEPIAHAFSPSAWIGVHDDGTVEVVDLATSRVRSLGSVDVADLVHPEAQVDGNELVLTGDGHARAFDLRTLAPTWRADDPLPGCGRLTYSGAELLAVDEPGDGARRIHRYLPRGGERLAGPVIPDETSQDSISEVRLNRRTGRFVLSRNVGYRDACWQTLSPDGWPLTRLPRELRLLPDEEHAVMTDIGGWRVFSVHDPEQPLVVGESEAVLGRAHVNLAAGMVAGQDRVSLRVRVWTLEGEPIASFDGVGEVRASSFAFTAGALWMLTQRGRFLYRFPLPDGPGGAPVAS